ncbi:MAG: ABC-type transport auxiliary lipoprotein family protein, partial [Wenzhouxiangella sp.]|nr:ABC-type transport auxiliary lipoprotein family protein [Wenzhouxiangella sp.]
MTEQGTLRLLALFLLTMPLLTACALVRNPAPLSILAPAVDVQPRSDQERVDWSLQIQRPMADAMRDSDRVLVRRSASRLQVYAGAAWLDSVPEMLQSKLVRVFADSGAFTGVSRAGGMRTRYSLASEIR